MKRTIGLVLLILWAAAGTVLAQDARIYSGGNVTRVLNPSTAGTHTDQFQNPTYQLDAGHVFKVRLYENSPGAATAALAGAGAGNVDDGAHSYKITFVTAGGETDAGTASAAVTVADKTVDGQVALSAIPTGTPGVVTSRKIYRTVAGDTGDYKLVATIADNTTTTYTDNTADSSLGAVAPSANTAVDARLSLTNASNFGIGTSSPSGPLHVKASGQSASLFLETATANDAVFRALNSAQQFSFGVRADVSNQFVIRDATAGADRLTIDTSGKVGIGTTGPGTTLDVAGTARASLFNTATNCSSSASPAVCAAAAAGSVVVAAAATTVQVNTTAVTANSQILLTEDSSLGTKLSVTCNTTTGRTYTVSARTAATSFTITASAAPVTNPACLTYLVVN